MGEYVGQGSKLYVEGRLQTSSWEDKQGGEKKYRTEIVAREIVLLGPAPGNGTEETARGPRRQLEPEHARASAAEITDEDIPF